MFERKATEILFWVCVIALLIAGCVGFYRLIADADQVYQKEKAQGVSR